MAGATRVAYFTGYCNSMASMVSGFNPTYAYTICNIYTKPNQTKLFLLKFRMAALLSVQLTITN